MLKITSIAGNIFQNNKFKSLKDGNFERLKVSRIELEKNRIRRETNTGTDVGLILDPGTTLQNGDVLVEGQKTIVVEQLPEKVIALRIKKEVNPTELLVLIGHIIGNRHRPFSIKNGVIFFPIQADSELEVFQRLFSEIISEIELSIENQVFRPHSGANVHEHG